MTRRMTLLSGGGLHREGVMAKMGVSTAYDTKAVYEIQRCYFSDELATTWPAADKTRLL